MNPDLMARGLGWFSLGLGFAELAFPEQLAETLGMEGREGLIPPAAVPPSCEPSAQPAPGHPAC